MIHLEYVFWRDRLQRFGYNAVNSSSLDVVHYTLSLRPVNMYGSCLGLKVDQDSKLVKLVTGDSQHIVEERFFRTQHTYPTLGFSDLRIRVKMSQNDEGECTSGDVAKVSTVSPPPSPLLSPRDATFPGTEIAPSPAARSGMKRLHPRISTAF